MLLQLSTSVKLNILLFVTAAALSVYLYYIIKEVKSFERTMVQQIQGLVTEVDALKQTASAAQTGAAAAAEPVPIIVPPSTPRKSSAATMTAVMAAAAATPLPPSDDEEEEQDEDSVSIMSNEIRNIISNIQSMMGDGDEDEEDEAEAEEGEDVGDDDGDDGADEGEVAAVAHDDREEDPAAEAEEGGENDDNVGSASSGNTLDHYNRASVLELQKEKYADLCAYLKQRGLSTRGNKDALIQRICEAQQK